MAGEKHEVDDDDSWNRLWRFREKRKRDERPDFDDGMQHLFDHADTNKKKSYQTCDPDNLKNSTWYRNYVASDKYRNDNTKGCDNFVSDFAPTASFSALLTKLVPRNGFPPRDRPETK